MITMIELEEFGQYVNIHFAMGPRLSVSISQLSLLDPTEMHDWIE